MTIVEVNLQSVLGSSNVPPKLVGLISQVHWNAISQSIQDAHAQRIEWIGLLLRDSLLFNFWISMYFFVPPMLC